jgi:hypothetical protein
MIQTNKQKIRDTENEIMVPMHEMKVSVFIFNYKKIRQFHSKIFSQLPLENWHDLLAFVPRCQLGNVVSQIGHRQFARIIQSFLHDEVREITLGRMYIIPPRLGVCSDLPMVKVWPNKATNIPDWPIPANIKDFKEIHLKFVFIYIKYCEFISTIISYFQICGHVCPQFLGKISRKFPFGKCESVC